MAGASAAAGEAPPLQQVVAAVRALHQPGHLDKDKAALWLDQLQKSIHSWKIADELLQQKLDVETCYYAAQTMKAKIQHSFFELPPESHSSLRDSLLEHISVITQTTNTAIITQLCLALADLALQMTSWTNPVEDLMNKFASNNIWALLEIMTVIPEEVLSCSMRLGANRREELKQYLLANSVIINQFLKQTLTNSNQNSQVSCKVIKCLTSWIAVKAINLIDIEENSVLSHTFQILGDHTSYSGLHDAAADCVCALLQCLEENETNEKVDRIVFHSVVLLEKSYHLAVAHEDQEKAMNYSRIFTELGESFLNKIINHSLNYKDDHFAKESLQLVLICVGHHDYEVAEISFHLWYRLSEELYKHDKDDLTLVFRPYVERLISALCRHCQMEPDHQGLLDKDDEFYDFRQKVSELTKDVVFIISSSNCFKQFFLSIQGADVSWERTEAALFIMQSVAKNILPEEYEVAPKVVEAILVMPESTHIAVKHTLVLLLGELCEWLEKHPPCLPMVLEYLLQALQNPALASATAHALQSICSACRNHMHVHLTGLLQIVHNLDSFCLTPLAAIDFLRGISSIIGCLPHKEISTVMHKVCAVQIVPLAALNNHGVANTKTGATDPTVWLDRLAALFRYCKISVKIPSDQTHPCLSVLNDIWPVLAVTMERYSSDLRIMEKLCRCLRFIIRFLGKQGSVIFDPLAKHMMVVYIAHRHCCFLYLASIVVDEFSEDQNCIKGLMEMLQALIGPTFELLQSSNLNQHPDTIDDLFRLCERFLQRIPLHFVQSTATDAILQCAMSACSLDHREANSTVMKFLSDFIHTGRSTKREYQPCVGLFSLKINQHGEALLANIIQASVFCLHSYMLHDVGSVIFELLSWNKEIANKWLETSLSALPQSGACATPAQLVQFHKEVTEAKSDKRVSESLRDFVRLYH